MRVLYDISMLGYGFARPDDGLTGIHRVVEELALRLAASPRCDLAFSAVDSLEDARRYLEGHPALGRCPLQWSPFLMRVRRRIEKAGQAIDGAHGLGRLGHRLERKLLGLPWWAWGGLPLPAYTAPDVSRADVFHSPSVPLPELTRQRKGVAKFQTVYDLVPLLFPEVATDEHLRAIRAVIAGVKEGGWALAISEATKRDLCSVGGIDPARVFVTPLAADPERFRPCGDPEQIAAVRARYGIPEGRYALSLCTLQPRKNQDGLMCAFAQLAHEPGMADCSLVLTGGAGWKAEKIHGAIARWPALKKRVILTGFVADEDLSALYTGATVFAYPSLYEGFGLPPLEAMQCGTPVITSDTSSLPEVVGDAGLMVDPRDGDALCQALLALCTQDDLRRDLSARSLRQAAGFHWDRCAELTLDAYTHALEVERA